MTGALTAVPVLGVDLLVVLAFLLLVAGVAGAVLPGMPAALLSLSGVLVYWWASGFTEPGTVVLVALVLTALLALAADWFGGAVAARVGGASTTTSVLAGVVAVALLFVAGPVGVLVGAAGTVFVLEYVRRRDATAGARAAGGFVLGFFASALVQALLTLAILLAMVVVAL